MAVCWFNKYSRPAVTELVNLLCVNRREVGGRNNRGDFGFSSTLDCGRSCCSTSLEVTETLEDTSSEQPSKQAAKRISQGSDQLSKRENSINLIGDTTMMLCA